MTTFNVGDLKAYVQGSSAGVAQFGGADIVVLNVSHSHLKQRFLELRFSLSTTVQKVKEQLQVKTGTSVECMQLQLKDEDGGLLVKLSEDDKLLGYYSPENGNWLHVLDANPNSIYARGDFEDLSSVEKYNISEEDYDKRSDSYRKFKHTMIERDPNWSIGKMMDGRTGGEGGGSSAHVPSVPVIDENYDAELAGAVRVGDRCEVNPGGKRGMVAFVGRAETLAPGFWVGVSYDEPVGKHDGIVKGKRYFQCAQRHGGMLRPNQVKVGDFPERDLFEDDDEDEI